MALRTGCTKIASSGRPFASGHSLKKAAKARGEPRRSVSSTPAARSEATGKGDRASGKNTNVKARASRDMSSNAVAAPKQSDSTIPATMHNFEKVEERFIDEYNAKAALFKHKTTGAELMSVSCDDENKVFGVVFRTPPEDSKGLPHILEHSVLNGSRKYPIKEPFVELIKGSLNTFLNAFTFPDRTCFPVASTNTQDFYNLMDVYLDSVFHPNCLSDRRIFEQEGWHYEVNEEGTSTPSDGSDLTYKGVVFNEMKGVYSNPDSVVQRDTQVELFPDNEYGVDSGGDPSHITSLSFDEFKSFHNRFYHPSNARIWVYGDDPLDERLRRADEYLSEFSSRQVDDSSVSVQPLWSEPKRMRKPYASSKNEDGSPAGLHYVSVSWLLGEDVMDVDTRLRLEFLNHLLLGTAASPLRKALEESGLGEEMIGGGMEDELRQPFFSIGLKGVSKENVDKAEALILDTLKHASRDGFTQQAVEAALNTIEFQLRENNTGSFPQGLAMMLTSMSSWLYGFSPFTPLQWEEPLEELKREIGRGEDTFRPLIEKMMIGNKHMLSLEHYPDTELSTQREDEEQSKLAQMKQSMREEDKEELKKENERLKERQDRAETADELKCVPTLSLADMPKEPVKVPREVEKTENGATILTHDLFTNNIAYAEVLFDLHSLSSDTLKMLPMFCRALTRMGTETEGKDELQERIGADTGGLSFSPFVSDVKDEDTCAAYLNAKTKATAEKAEKAFHLMRQVLETASLNDRSVFKQLVLESRSSLERKMVSGGHGVAEGRLEAQRSFAGWASEQMNGLSQLVFLRELSERVDSDWEGVEKELEMIRTSLLRQRGTVASVTASGEALKAARKGLDQLLKGLPRGEEGEEKQWEDRRLEMKNELLTVPTQVNYVAKAANLYEDANYSLGGESMVVTKHLSMAYLWDKIRVSGGAYGAFCDFKNQSGMLSYLSFRDPNLLHTLDAYDGVPDYLERMDFDDHLVTKAIVGTIGDLDSHQLPDMKGHSSLMRFLLHVSDDERQWRRDQVLSTSASDFRHFGETLECVRGEHARVAAVTSPEMADDAQKQRPHLNFDVKRVL